MNVVRGDRSNVVGGCAGDGRDSTCPSPHRYRIVAGEAFSASPGECYKFVERRNVRNTNE